LYGGRRVEPAGEAGNELIAGFYNSSFHIRFIKVSIFLSSMRS
jgi:hypothetical protein